MESAGRGGPPPSDRRGSAIDVVVHAPIRLHRDGVVALLARCPEVRVVDATGSGEAARATVGRARPAVVVVDAAPAIDVELLHDLASRAPTPRVVVLGMPEEDELVLACAAAGVIGYLAPDDTADDLIAAIERADADETSCSTRVAGILLRQIAAVPRANVRIRGRGHLTARELQVSALIASGSSNKEIGTQLGIELATVKNHVHHILEKLELPNRAQIIVNQRPETWGRSPAS